MSVCKVGIPCNQSSPLSVILSSPFFRPAQPSSTELNCDHNPTCREPKSPSSPRYPSRRQARARSTPSICARRGTGARGGCRARRAAPSPGAPSSGPWPWPRRGARARCSAARRAPAASTARSGSTPGTAGCALPMSALRLGRRSGRRP